MSARLFIIITAITGVFFTSGCTTHDHPAESAPGGGGAVTFWTGKTELFMEYPGIVAGKEVRFAVHLTTMNDFKAVTAGKLSLGFRHPDGTVISSEAAAPSSPGIYRPTALFDKAGSYSLTMVLAGVVADTLRVEGIPVYATEGELPPEEEAGGEELITFLKEQQWKIDFRTEPVRTAPIAGSIHAAGEIVPRLNGEAIVAAPFTGFVPAGTGEELPLPGTRVARGRKLATMIPAAETPGGSEDFASRYADATTGLDLAAREWERAKRLYAIEGISEREYQEAEASMRRAEATAGAFGGVTRGGGGESAGGTITPGFFLVAPISGTVIDVDIVPGKQVDAGEPLFRIIDLSSVWIRVNIPVLEAGRVTKPRMAWMDVSGLSGPLVISGPGGRLVSVGSAVEPETRSVPIVFEVGNADGRLRVGMTGEVYIATSDERRALVVPESALIEEDGRYIVYVHVDGEGFARRDVALGAREPGRVEILTGIAESERVVTAGAYQVRLASLSSQLPAHGHEH